METLSLEQAKKAASADRYGLIPLTRELYADAVTPVEVMRILKNVSRHCYMLESAEDNKQWGRYTFLGYDPALEITCHDGRVKIKNSFIPRSMKEIPGNIYGGYWKRIKALCWRGFPRLQAGW